MSVDEPVQSQADGNISMGQVADEQTGALDAETNGQLMVMLGSLLGVLIGAALVVLVVKWRAAVAKGYKPGDTKDEDEEGRQGGPTPWLAKLRTRLPGRGRKKEEEPSFTSSSVFTGAEPAPGVTSASDPLQAATSRPVAKSVYENSAQI